MPRLQRRSLRFEDWPQVDREAWDELLRDGDVLEGRGAGAHWAAATRATLQSHYGVWLAWLARRDALGADVSPADRVTPDQVADYVRWLMSEVSPKTVESRVRDLKVIAKAMAPAKEWGWLKALSNRLKSWAVPSRQKVLPNLSASEMHGRVLQKLARLATKELPTQREVVAYRDTLIVALMLCAPVRLKNLAMIRIGEHLQQEGAEWHLRFAASETKTHQPIHLVLHAHLSGHLVRYIGQCRALLGAWQEEYHLWITVKGSPMSPEALYQQVRKVTSQLFGIAMSPHDFRTVGATALAEASPEDALHARALLGHRHPATTENHYIRAQQIQASNHVAAELGAIKAREK